MDTFPHNMTLGSSGSNRLPIHSRIRQNKRSTAIKFIQNRWRQIQKSSSGISSKRVCANERYGDTTTSENGDTAEEGSIQPTLLFRRPNNEMNYTSVHFLNSSTVLGVNTSGKFDIVKVPSWKEDGEKEYDTNRGRGKLLAELKLSAPTKYTSSDIEVYGYQNGSKFAAGMNSGDMEIISTERISSMQQNGDWCPPMEALWGSLPPVSTQLIGPRRRFLRSERFSLPYMLSLTDYETLLEASRDHSTLNELPFWDDFVNFKILRPISTTKRDFAPEKQWAFREGGVGSSTALVAACIDPEMDCFSLRIADERTRETESRPTIFVDTPPYLHVDEHVKSICFSNSHGLVVGYHDMFHQTNALKFYDLRMMWKQPTVSMNLSFPRNDTACIRPTGELNLERKEPLSAESYWTEPAILGTLHSKRSNDNYRDHHRNGVDSSFVIAQFQLTGPDSASDNFAASLRLPPALGGSNYHHVIIDSTRNEIVHQIGAVATQRTSSTCFSSCLDSMACMRTDGGYEDDSLQQFLSIYDISHSRGELINRHPNTNKRRFTLDNAKSGDCLATLKTKMTDIYGLHSTAINMAMDDYGSTIAMVTDEGDIYTFSP